MRHLHASLAALAATDLSVRGLATGLVILRGAAILLLNEATRALDSQSEALGQEALQHLTEARTTIVIAHRLSTVPGANTIVVIGDSEVIEAGPSAELLARGGAFRALYEAQFDRVIG